MEPTYHSYDFTGDGTLYSNGLMGLISRTPFLPEELPEPSYIYILHRPKRRRHTWILESMENEIDVIEREDIPYAFDDTPSVAYVCFVVEPDFDYLTFDEEDYDTYIEWNSEHTMENIIEFSQEED